MNQAVSNTDSYLFAIAVVMAFPVGMGVATLLRWVSQTMRDPQRQKRVANYWQFLGTWGVPFSLAMAMLKVVGRDTQGLVECLSECVLFVSMFFGAWTETRLFQNRR
jgi:uncharacterized membrane protein YdcZ (DUF606 family)